MHHSPKIYGTATINDKGQLVIPAEARSTIGLEPGTRVMIMGSHIGNAIIVVRTEDVEAHIQSFTAALGEPSSDNPEQFND